MKYSEILNERVYSASLYHGTGLFNAARIIEDNKIEDKTSQGFGDWENPIQGVSLTRNKEIAFGFGYVVFELDQSKLKHNNKIVPIDFWHEERKRFEKPDEQEEFCIGPIKNLSRCLKGIYINNNLLWRAKEFGNSDYMQLIFNHPLFKPTDSQKAEIDNLNLMMSDQT